MGPAATTTAYPLLFPAARLSARGPPRQGRPAAPAAPAGLRPVLDPHGPLTRIGSSRETGHAQAPGRHASGPVRMPPNAAEHGQKTCKTPLDTAPLLQG